MPGRGPLGRPRSWRVTALDVDATITVDHFDDSLRKMLLGTHGFAAAGRAAHVGFFRER